MLSRLVIAEGNGTPFQYSCLENPRDSGDWWSAVYGIAQSQTQMKRCSSSRLVITFLPRSKHLLISWLQSPSPVILEPKKIKSLTVSIVFPSICHEVMGSHAMILVFWMLSFKPNFSLSSFTFTKRLFSPSSLAAIRVVSSAYLMLFIFLPAILIPAYASCRPVFLMIFSAYKLNKQGDNIQPFPIWNQFVVPCPVLTIASWPAYRFLKRQIRWSGIPMSFRIFHGLLWSTQSKALA